MKIKVPSKTVDACDICKQPSGSGQLTRCVVCKKEYCLYCEAIMCGFAHQPDVCKECAQHEAVEATVKKFANPLFAVLKRRNKALTALRRRITTT